MEALDFNSLESCLAWLQAKHDKLDKKIDLNLDKLLPIAKKLNLEKFNCPVITVAGTNGKGSTVNYLANLLIADNNNVGVYSSPHLLCFTERIKINNVNIAPKDCINSFKYLYANLDYGQELTFFEFTTLVALIYFKQAKLDYLILEVGLGGRLDAVNVVFNDIAIITSIAYDHMEYLGDTLEQIAYEKAGIIKNNSTVINGANEFDIFKQQANKYSCAYYEACGNKNLALTAYRILGGANNLSTDFLNKYTLPGRMQIISKNLHNTYILDVAHNKSAIDFLYQSYHDMVQRDLLVWPKFAILGLMQDKLVPNLLQSWLGIIKNWIVVALPTDRASSVNDLAKFLTNMDESINIILKDNVALAIKFLEDKLEDNKVLIFGSFFTVAAGIEVLCC